LLPGQPWLSQKDGRTVQAVDLAPEPNRTAVVGLAMVARAVLERTTMPDPQRLGHTWGMTRCATWSGFTEGQPPPRCAPVCSRRRPGRGRGALLTGYGEDLLRYRPTALGQNTTGAWSIYFDGSDVGLSGSLNLLVPPVRRPPAWVCRDTGQGPGSLGHKGSAPD
jgi:hypothetical protein